VSFPAGRGGWKSGRSGVRGHEDGLTPLAISPRQRLDDAIRAVSDLPFGGTDCALPMRYALERKRAVDTSVVCTDSQTWCGQCPPCPGAP
jgi:60 kDa SS-A/Ro ribonucleoprotein